MKPGNTKAIEDMFNTISSRYDLLNDIFSFGLHRIWKRKMLHFLKPIPDEKWIDLCCGTGDMSILLAKHMKSSENITGIDSASKALSVAKKRSKRKFSSIEWIKGDAIETNFPSDKFDGLLMAYGLRNLSDCNSGLREAFRILKPGGRAGFLDFCSLEEGSFRYLFQKFYLSFYVVPVASIFGFEEEYSYIKKSLKNFPSGEKQINLAYEVGFKKAEYKEIAKGQMGILIVES